MELFNRLHIFDVKVKKGRSYLFMNRLFLGQSEKPVGMLC